ncbi:MAG: hypothetical protein ACTSRK_00360 [Promethearchaeota archaeon]
MNDLITKNYRCPLCKINHSIEVPKDLALNRPAYPFTHTYIHSYETKSPSSDSGKDVLTILYNDKIWKFAPSWMRCRIPLMP